MYHESKCARHPIISPEGRLSAMAGIIRVEVGHPLDQKLRSTRSEVPESSMWNCVQNACLTVLGLDGDLNGVRGL